MSLITWMGSWAVCFCLGAALVACGGGSTETTAAGVAAPAVATVPQNTVTAAVTPAAVTAVLSLDFGNLANYASPVLPVYYDQTVRGDDNTPAGNPVIDRAAVLGRVLFYDKQLSVNNTVACASCHQQASGFDDPRRFSLGFAGSAFTTAHAMRLANIRYYRPGSTFWDKRTVSVEAQASQPIQHPVEMGFDASNGGLAALLLKLQNSSYYPSLFTLAFGDSAVTEVRIQRALAQFQRSMVSTNSKWDAGYALTYAPLANDRGLDTPIASFTAEENRGRALFLNPPGAGGVGCAGCHSPPTFALAGNSLSNGLDAGETRVFKSPSLKSVGLSSAFMHDGRFSSLAQVVEHYNSGVLAGPALDNRLTGQGNQPRRLNLSAADKAALVAFLRTLDDSVLASDVKFSTPFRF